MEPQGIAAGYLQGQDRISILRQRALQIQQGEAQLAAAKQDLQAQAAAMSGLGGGPQQPQQPGSMPMQPSQQMPPRPGTLTQQPPMQPQGGQPLMQTAPQAAPQPRPGMPPGTPGGGQPPPTQQPPTGQPGGQGGYGSGVQNVQDPQTIIQGIAQRIKAANPGMDGATLFQATTKVIGLMKGVDNETKNALNAELKILQIQRQADDSVRKAQSAAEVATIRADSQNQISQLRLQIAQMYEGGRDRRFEAGEEGRDRRQGVTEGGKDTRLGVTEGGKDRRLTTTEAGKDTRAAAKIAFTPKMGDLMSALAEKGVSLPTGFRSKEQQAALYQSLLDRHPGMSVEDIATGIKNGAIQFGAEKKQTQTAAAIAGRVLVAENEITQFAPLVREASAAVPRGNFVPINKLIQMGDSSISDPKLKQLKIYINSLLNAYDILAARGGTDVNKREATRNLLLSADGPKALEAGLKAFEMEAKAAHRAAMKATKVQSDDDEGGSGGGGGSAGIAVGEVHDGYRFKGGNARDKASWEKVAE